MRPVSRSLALASTLVAAVACTSDVEPPTAAPSPRNGDEVQATSVPAAAGEVVLDNLANPRGLTFGPEGALYVAEAGRGGAPNNTGPCFVLFAQKMCYGNTGAVTRLWHGRREQIVTDLPSYAQVNSGAAEGPNGISMNGLGNAYVTIGLEGDPHLREAAPELAGLGQLVKLAPWVMSPGGGNGPDRARWEFAADLAQYEVDANPDCGDIDSNPFGVLAEGGDVIIADAGANALVRRDATGALSTLAAFANNTTIPGPGCPTPASHDFVPTSIVRGPDGAYYIGHLNGLPIVTGSATVWRMEPGGTPEPYRTGFTWILAIAFDANGNLYVLQRADAAPASTPGSLIRVTPEGVRTVLVTGIPRAGGLAVDDEGRAYVSMVFGPNSKSPGEVRRYTP